MEACQRVEPEEAESEHLKEALTRTDNNLAKARIDLASKKERREAEVVKAKEELAETEKTAKEKAMGKYKASTDFVKKA